MVFVNIINNNIVHISNCIKKILIHNIDAELDETTITIGLQTRELYSYAI